MFRIRTALACGIVGMFAALATPSASYAQATVAPGWDLLQTQPGTMFAGVPFQGVPLGSYDFGGTIGTQATGPTDTIVERLGPAMVPMTPGMDTIPIELVALQLVSVVPVDFGAGLGFHYVTLQSDRGGPASQGMMTIPFNDPAGGTFDSFFDVFFDIRLSSPSGPIIFSDMERVQSGGVPWDRTPPPLAVVIDGVNKNLNGVNNAQDFWPVGPFSEQGTRLIHVVDTALVPEPATLALLLTGGLPVAGRVLRRRRS